MNNKKETVDFAKEATSILKKILKKTRKNLTNFPFNLKFQDFQI